VVPLKVDKTDRTDAGADWPRQRRKREYLQSSRRLMSDRIDFEIVCPNDHDQTVTFALEEFEAELKSGALVFHCNTCDTDWPPSHEDIAKFRRRFAKNSG
jgi:hypothetical protein